MASARPPGGVEGNTPTARLELNLDSFRNAPNVVREAGRAAAREASQAFRALQNEQRIALTQAQQTLAVVRAQQTQITATTRSESSQRLLAARTEAQAAQQAARVAANAQIEEQRRITASHRTELRIREAQERAAARSVGMAQGEGGFARGVTGAVLGSLGGPVGAIAGAAAGGALPAAAGLAIAEGARYAVQASATATAYARQRAAAVSLAGSQARLNELMESYHRSTRRASSESQALANLTNLMAQGFADSSEELDTFLRGVRGASVAMGQPQEFIISRLQLEMLNQTGQRLNEVGLGMEAVRERADALRAANRNLSQEQAYQQAVLEELAEKYGAVADSPLSDPTGPERVATAWDNLTLTMGRLVKPLTDVSGNLLADDLDREIQKWQAWEQVIRNVGIALNMLPENARFDSPGVRSGGSIGGGATPSAGSNYTAEQIAQQTAAKLVRFDALNEITKDEINAVLDVTRQTSEQRANIIRRYEESTSRETEDFGRQRLYAERRFNLSLLDVAQDSARQRTRWAADTEREINEAAADRDERIAKARDDSAERISEIEERFNRDRLKRQQQFGEQIRDAAASLDAVRVRELQRERRLENKEAREAHNEAVADERESLQERIDEANQAFVKQEAQQREALQRRIDLQAEDDRLRIDEMKAAWEEQREQEDIERGIRLERQAEDHAAQLIELDNQAAARIEQIKTHAKLERDQVELDFQASMSAAGVRLRAYEDYIVRREQAATDSFDRFYNHMENRFLGAPIQGPNERLPIPTLAPPVGGVRSGGSIGGQRTSTINIAPGAIQIVPPPDMALDSRFAAFIMNVLNEFFEDMPQ